MNEGSEQTLTFSSSPVMVTFGVVLVLVTIVLGIVAWQRSGWARGIGVLELLRVLIVVLVAVTLLQPEVKQLFKPDQKPVLAILYDDSESMTTADLAEGKTRKKAVLPFIDPATWTSLEERMEVIFEPFSQAAESTDLNKALADTAERHDRLRGVVLASDGDWNAGKPPIAAATKLRTREVPVFAIPIGSETRLPDIEVTALDAPTFGVAGKPVRIPFTIESAMPEDVVTTVELTTSTGKAITKEVTLPAMGKFQDTMIWEPEKTGEAILTFSIPEIDGELVASNNSLEVPISIRKEELKVLVVEAYPRWEYRYLRNALERDPGVEVTCLLFHPSIGKKGGGRGYIDAFPSEDDLGEFDVIFLGDVGAGEQLTEEQCTAIQKMVRDQAAGLVFLPGFRGAHFSLLGTDLKELYPVLLDDRQPRGWGSPVPGQFELTGAGSRSLLTKLEDSDAANARLWQQLPGFQWYAPVLRAKAGSEVLATHSSESTQYGRVPLIVTRTYGTGKILFMGTDGAWRWREGVEDRYHYRFWGQVARWMAYQRNMAQGEQLRLFYSPDRPKAGGAITLNANAIGSSGEPLRDATIIVEIIKPDGDPETVRLAPAGGDAWGLFTGSYSPEEAGDYQVTVTCAESGAVLDTTISVQGGKKEKVGRPARPEVLAEIARITRGEVLMDADPAAVVEKIRALPEPEPKEKRVRLWAHPAWAGAIVFLMIVFWVGRKVVGVV